LPMKILYIGQGSGTSLHRINALKRLGHDVALIDPYIFIPNNRLIVKWVHDSGLLGMSALIERQILASLDSQTYDAAWINGGDLISPHLINTLRNQCGHILNYNNDDPFSLPQYGEYNRWRLYRQSIPFYDLLVVVRPQNVEEVKAKGARKVLRVHLSADEVEHQPVPLSPEEYQTWQSEVCFIGTWFPERGPFMAELIRRGIPLSIWGDRWQKAREWNLIKEHWRGPACYNKDYNRIIQSAKINLGLLSKGNRNLHTRRSIEIPFLGKLLCAEQTVEHEQMYIDGKEAVFWTSAEECAERCFELLQDPIRIDEIAGRGHHRCLKNNYFNEPILTMILNEIETQGAEK